MPNEHTNLISGAQLLAETLQSQYALDPEDLFEAAGLDYGRLAVPAARYPRDKLVRLWQLAVERSGDPCLGLVVGARVRATSLHAIGFSWLSSETLRQALQRLIRYYRILSTAPGSLSLVDEDDHVALALQEADQFPPTQGSQVDAFAIGVVTLGRMATSRAFSPVMVTLNHPDHGRAGDYVDAFQAPVRFGARNTRLILDRADLDRPLPGHNPELADANDQVAERYLASLEPERVATRVRELLCELLPSGEISQNDVAKRMNRSLSTLQRQLHAEGMNFQELRDNTRRSLAEDYIRQHDLSLGQIAYLLGFSDQSNFSRAFKRWTGMAPRDYRG